MKCLQTCLMALSFKGRDNKTWVFGRDEREKQLKIPGRDGQPVVIKNCVTCKKHVDWMGAFWASCLQQRASEQSIMECRWDICLWCGWLHKTNAGPGEKAQKRQGFVFRCRIPFGMRREDRLRPIITLALFYGEDQLWDGPYVSPWYVGIAKALEPWKHIPNYPLNLVYSSVSVLKTLDRSAGSVWAAAGSKDKDSMEEFLRKTRSVTEIWTGRKVSWSEIFGCSRW